MLCHLTALLKILYLSDMHEYLAQNSYNQVQNNCVDCNRQTVNIRSVCNYCYSYHPVIENTVKIYTDFHFIASEKLVLPLLSFHIMNSKVVCQDQKSQDLNHHSVVRPT